MDAAHQASPGPVQIPAKRRDSSLRKKKISRSSAGGQKEAFYTAAQPDQVPLMYFDVKYYGLCNGIPTGSAAPVMVNVTRLLDEKKKATGVVKGQMYFSDKGLAVIPKGSTSPVVSWFTFDIASMASVKHPLKPSRRIALMKVRNPAGALEWHLFKYQCGRKDHMSESFRYIVDCSLRDIGRAVATGEQQVVRRGAPAALASPAAAYSPEGAGSPRLSQLAWGGESPPKYSDAELLDAARSKGPAPKGPPMRRRLDMDALATAAAPLSAEAAQEAYDIAQGMQRLSLFNGAAPLYDEPDQQSGYMLVKPPTSE